MRAFSKLAAAVWATMGIAGYVKTGELEASIPVFILAMTFLIYSEIKNKDGR